MMEQTRYSRQLPIPAIGEAGQKRLLSSSVLVLGCGGLGSSVLFALASAGVGTIGFVDDDDVSLSNLNRQFLYSMDNIGRSKVDAAHERLTAYNPELRYRPVHGRLTEENAEKLLLGYDLAVLALDTLASRLAANKACFKMRIPLVNGGVDGFSGALNTVLPGKGACLACLYGNAAETEAHAASFAPVVQVVGALEAQIALLLLLGYPDPLKGKLLSINGGMLEFIKLPIYRDPNCPVCGTGA